MVAFYMQEVHTKCFHQFCLQEGLVFVLGFVGFLNISFNLEVMMREKFRGGGSVRIAKRSQADHGTLRLQGQNGTAQHPQSVYFQTSWPQTGI